MMSATTITLTMVAILFAIKVMREGMSKGMRLKLRDMMHARMKV